MKRLIYKILRGYLEWKYRYIQDDTCCCGDSINHSPWEGHQPVSAKQYYLNGKLEKWS